MLFVALFKPKPGPLQERIARRMAWQPPPGSAEAVAEYWLESPDTAVITVFKADAIGQIWMALEGWHDLFEISIHPAVTAEEGLEILKQMPSG